MKKRVKNLTSEIHELLEQVPPDLFSSDDDMQDHMRMLVDWCVKERLPSLQDVWDANQQKAFCTVDDTQSPKGLTHFLLKAFAARCTPRVQDIISPCPFRTLQCITPASHSHRPAQSCIHESPTSLDCRRPRRRFTSTAIGIT